MAVGAWTFIKRAKHNLGIGKLVLSGGVYKMALFTSAGLFSAAYNHSTYNSAVTVGGEAGTGTGYTAGGGTKGTIANTWLSALSAGNQRFTYTAARVWTASGAGIANIKFAVIYTSGANSAAKKLLCYSQLSTSQFSISAGNTLTITASGTGVFNLT